MDSEDGVAYSLVRISCDHDATYQTSDGGFSIPQVSHTYMVHWNEMLGSWSDDLGLTRWAQCGGTVDVSGFYERKFSLMVPFTMASG